MALTIHKVNETSTSYELGETMWLTADRDEVVPEGDARAAYLLGTAGKRISAEEAERLGLHKGAKTKNVDVTPSESKDASPEGDKSSEPEGDKEAKPESIKDIVARIGDMSDEELEALSSDERKGVQKALAAEHEARASSPDEATLNR